MTRKNKQDNNEYQKRYYKDNNLKEIQRNRARLNYWRKQYMKKFNCSLLDCKDMTEIELRDEINTGLCSV